MEIPLPVDKFQTFNIETNKPKYDWFAGMISDNDLERIDGIISSHLEVIYPAYDGYHNTAELGNYREKKRLFVAKNYKYAIHYYEGSESICSLSFGGSNHQYGLYLTITGRHSEYLFLSLRTFLITHQLRISTSRLDVAYDIQGKFKPLLKRLISLCRSESLEYKIYTSNAKDGKTQGTTLYVKVTEMITLRVYEKGYERLAEGVSDAPLDWIRFEVENDIPKNRQYEDAKWFLPTVPKMKILTATEKLTKLFNAFSGISLSCANIVYTKKPFKKTLDERLETFVHQNRNLLLELLDNPENTEKLIEKMFFEPSSIPSHLTKSNPFNDYLEHKAYLKNGDYFMG
ncbi:MAG: replication initiation factor domain-containing protein [Prolixibacteraceae bacterium]|nr:replication initiation factor domain-containing protein [Prolixibacteraceae bacterium]